MHGLVCASRLAPALLLLAASVAVAQPVADPEDRGRAALQPLLQQIRDAESSRASIEVSSDTIIDRAVIDTETAVYQVVSARPGKFTVLMKDGQQRSRIYCDGKQTVIVFSSTAYTVLDQPLPLQRAVFDLPLPLGPYPEPVLAMTLAGVDPAQTFLRGMKSVRLLDQGKFRGQVPALHLEGVQSDDVRWEFWITQDESPRPLRLLVDLTAMLHATSEVDLPPGYRLTLRFDFKAWHLDYANEESLFHFRPTASTKRYDSVEKYFEAMAN